MTRTALIIGSAGQDGNLLGAQLRERGYDVTGIARDGGTAGERLDIRDAPAVAGFVRCRTPDEIYFLAGHHHSSEERRGDDGELYRKSAETHVDGLVNMLEAMAAHAPAARLFYAASSHLFGRPDRAPQDESTPFQPDSIYGITKLSGLMMCRYYRRQRGLFAAVGILYNHESPLRAEKFISRKLARAAARVKRGLDRQVVVGSLEAAADWGYAPDFADAMRRILQADAPDDYVVATGRLHTVRDMAEIAFGHVGLDYRQHVSENAAVVQRSLAPLCGDASKLRRVTGWQPTADFEAMMKLMVEAELDRLDG